MSTKDQYVQIPLEEGVYPVKPLKTAATRLPVRRCSPCTKVFVALLVLFVVLPLTLTILAGVSGYFYFAGKVKSLTVEEPRSFPVVNYPEGELQLTKDRVTMFFDTLQAGRVPANDLVVTEDEVNGLIAASDYLRGNAFVHMEEDMITFDMSLPMNFLPGGKGRYFVANGVGTVTGDTLSVDVDAPIKAYDGKLVTGLLKFSLDERKHHVMTLVSGKALGKEPCDKFYEDNHNLLDIFDDEEIMNVLDGLESIMLENGQIIFKARSTPAASSKFDYEGAYSFKSSSSPSKPWHLLRLLF